MHKLADTSDRIAYLDKIDYFIGRTCDPDRQYHKIWRLILVVLPHLFFYDSRCLVVINSTPMLWPLRHACQNQHPTHGVMVYIVNYLGPEYQMYPESGDLLLRHWFRVFIPC